MSFSLYGFLLGCSIVVGISVAEKVLQTKKEEKTWNLGLVSIVLGGVLGARAYHVVTDWSLYSQGPWWEILAIWHGGLGFIGAVIGGGAGLYLWKKYCQPPWSWTELLNAAALALPFSQALGRWGNFVNQELYGLPTTLPWGLIIDSNHRPATFPSTTRFHPLFLYESLGDLAIGLALLFVWRKYRKKRSSILLWPLYLISYGTLRFLLEFLRLSSAPGWLHLTIAQWWCLLAIAVGLTVEHRSWRQSQS